MDLELKGQRVLVTGGSKGIGRATAEAFAAEGCDILITSRHKEALDKAAGEIRSRHQVRVDVFPADLSSPKERDMLAVASGDIDILVNNAGAIPGGSIMDLSMAKWEEAWALKVMGYIHLTQLYLRAMQKKKAGTIINIIGQAATAPRWDYVCGAAGNAALNAFTNAIGSRSVDFGVRVFGINPAGTETDRVITLAKTKARTELGDENRWRETVGNLPFGRWAKAEEIGALAVMLASPKVAYVSGHVLDVDGGQKWRK